MTKLLVSFPELADILRACGPVRSEDSTPNLLRSIVASRMSG